MNPPNGRFTDGGGIVNNQGRVEITDSVISDNTSEVTAAVPSTLFSDVDQEANAGRLSLTPGSTTTITRSRISGNTVRASNSAGDVEAESGGIDSDGALVLTDTSVDRNTAAATAPASSGFTAEADGGGMQVQGVTTMRGGRIGGNTVTATTPAGVALGLGGGVFNLSGSVTLDRVLLTANSGATTGVGGLNVGGGIGNIQFGGPPPQLTITDSVITANRLAASAGISSRGGGLFTVDVFSGQPFPVTLTRTVIEVNKPDQCVGC